VAHSRHLALRLARSGTTVNAVAIPDPFPSLEPPPSAPIRTAVGIDDLAYVVRFFGHPDNGYVIGQLISLCGGDDVWANHSL
jgi:hypothetical protein